MGFCLNLDVLNCSGVSFCCPWTQCSYENKNRVIVIICLLDEIEFNLIIEHIFDFAIRIGKVTFNLISEINGEFL